MNIWSKNVAGIDMTGAEIHPTKGLNSGVQKEQENMHSADIDVESVLNL